MVVKCHHWGLSSYICFRITQFMKVQMSGKICSFKLIKSFFYFSFSVCQNVLWMRIRHSLATLLFFVWGSTSFFRWNTWKDRTVNLPTEAKVHKSEDWRDYHFDMSVFRATLWIRLETDWNVSCCIQPSSNRPGEGKGGEESEGRGLTQVILMTGTYRGGKATAEELDWKLTDWIWKLRHHK